MTTYEQVFKDYLELKRLHDGEDPADLTGGFVDGEWYKRLLANPTKTEAKKHIFELIEYSLQSGFETVGNPRLYIPAVKEIYTKYGFLSEGT